MKDPGTRTLYIFNFLLYFVFFHLWFTCSFFVSLSSSLPRILYFPSHFFICLSHGLLPSIPPSRQPSRPPSFHSSLRSRFNQLFKSGKVKPLPLSHDEILLLHLFFSSYSSFSSSLLQQLLFLLHLLLLFTHFFCQLFFLHCH